jgi:hypothetical protein
MANNQIGAGGEERLEIDRVFERSRLDEGLMVCAYENLVRISRQSMRTAWHIEPGREFSGRIDRGIQPCAIGM